MKNNMGKKVLTTTLATALIFGSVSGIPYSSKGLLTQLGVTTPVVQAQTAPSGTLPNSTLLNLFNLMYNSIEPSDKTVISSARTKLAGQSSNLPLVSGIWTKINTKIAASSTPSNYSDVTQQALLDLLIQAGTVKYDSSGAYVLALIHNASNRQVVDELIKLAGYSGINYLTLSDAADFGTALKSQIKAAFQNKTNTELATLITNKTAMEGLIKQAVQNVLNNNTLKVSNVINGLGITVDDMITLKNNVFAVTDDANASVRKAIVIAVLRSGTAVTTAVSNSGATVTPTLTIFDKQVPNDLLTWYKDSGDSNVSINSSGTITLDSGTTGNIVFSVQDPLYNKTLYTSSTVTLTKSSTGGVIVPPVVTPPADNTPADPKKVLNDLTKKLSSLPGKGGLHSIQARKATVQAVKKISTVNASKSVTTKNGIATANLDTKSLENKMQQIVNDTKKANDALHKADPNAKSVAPTVRIDLGNQKAKKSQATISKDLVSQATKLGIKGFGFSVNDTSMSVPISDLHGQQTTISITKRNDGWIAPVFQNNNLKQASSAYDLGIYQNKSNTKLENFKTPVTVSLPYKPTPSTNTDYLTVMRINDDGTLSATPAKYENGKVTFKRNGLSTYVAVEHKVSFNDIASVQEWAGRQIEIIASKGIAEGRGPGKFDPNAKITRAEFAKMLVLTFGLEGGNPTQNFSDVHTGDWFEPYVAAAVQAGIVHGKTNELFAPNDYITRAEMATMAGRALVASGDYNKIDNPDQYLQQFADQADIHSSLKDGVALASSLGVIIGEGNHKFAPNSDSTRAQAAVIIYRLLSK